LAQECLLKDPGCDLFKANSWATRSIWEKGTKGIHLLMKLARKKVIKEEEYVVVGNLATAEAS
jgi:hypothetical protein